MIDYILDLSFDARENAVEDEILARLFTTASSGSSSSEIGGTTTISAYFETETARDDAAAALAGMSGVECKTLERPRVDWLERYEQSLEPILIGTRFIVAPDPRLIGHVDRLPIVVPQEQAFGTGSHETTALCIEMLEVLETKGRRGLDIGSGSGILAIAMLRLGAARAIAFDNDLDAYGALRDNRARNSIADSTMPLFIGGLEALGGGEFDVVTMNIIPEVILPLLGEVVVHLKAGAALILSGILVTRSKEVIHAAGEHDLRLLKDSRKGEWWCGLFEPKTVEA
jgi:ribosomal protein L11 methyltransferase